jgi:hypothetical protein
MTLLNQIALGAVVVLLIGIFIGGCQYGKSRVQCPTITTTTQYIHDTINHYIPNDIYHYNQGKDTIIYRDSLIYQYHDVDTVAILRDYYALHTYNRLWTDTLIRVDLVDVISENKPISNKFKYTLLKPQTSIVNTITPPPIFKNRLYAGLSCPVYGYKDFAVSVQAQYSTPKYLFGAYADPVNKVIGANFGINILNK